MRFLKVRTAVCLKGHEHFESFHLSCYRNEILFSRMAVRHLQPANLVSMKHTLLLLLLCSSCMAGAQTGMLSTNPAAEQAMLGNYDPAAYLPAVVISHPDSVSRGINARVSPDSLHAYLDALRTFHNRNSGSDTVSDTRGIGAARRWVYSKFEQFSAAEGGRLLPSYLQFNRNICGQVQHRDIFAVLPGTDTSDKGVMLVEAHIDSRCVGLCDTSCLAEGMEDNGSGTALVMELARVMSHYTFRRTIVFLLVIAEEQGLYGAQAFADYAVQKGIKIRTVFNNDVVGGIICGQTSSPPSCPGLNAIDSTNVRLFSFGTFNSPHKQLARFVKLEYQEQLLPYVRVPMTIHIMNDEDRIGRGGDHIPFRQDGFTAIRFTAANENGDAYSSRPNYTDRQHTSSDILGVDTDNDGELDSFFVDFDYLARNTVINANGAAIAALGPDTPSLSVVQNGGNIDVQITKQTGYPQYRFAVRSNTNDWDTVFTVSGPGPHQLPISAASGTIEVSAASVDSQGVESLFSSEKLLSLGVSPVEGGQSFAELLQNKPNPFDETTTIGVLVKEELPYREAYILISDAASGRTLQQLPIRLKKGIAEVVYKHGYHASGACLYSLVIDGKQVQTRKMVFAN